MQLPSALMRRELSGYRLCANEALSPIRFRRIVLIKHISLDFRWHGGPPRAEWPPLSADDDDRPIVALRVSRATRRARLSRKWESRVALSTLHCVDSRASRGIGIQADIHEYFLREESSIDDTAVTTYPLCIRVRRCCCS